MPNFAEHQRVIQSLRNCIEGLCVEIECLENSKTPDRGLIIDKIEQLTKARCLMNQATQACESEQGKEQKICFDEAQKKQQEELIRRSDSYMLVKHSYVELSNN